ncbi:hypothetical protein QM201_10920 [Enterobacter asburiae]|nr:hypothetical protein [Enterobacter asburiae]
MLDDNISGLKKEIESALTALNIDERRVDNAEFMLNAIKHKFVAGDPRAWWLSLKNKIEARFFEDNAGYKCIPEIAHTRFQCSYDEDVFLVVDMDNEVSQLYCIPVKVLTSLIEACRYFEYYVVAKDLSWLICENDHGEIITCKAPNHL